MVDVSKGWLKVYLKLGNCLSLKLTRVKTYFYLLIKTNNFYTNGWRCSKIMHNIRTNARKMNFERLHSSFFSLQPKSIIPSNPKYLRILLPPF
jgi:hypothetical protein